jgi:hypothetical protein
MNKLSELAQQDKLTTKAPAELVGTSSLENLIGHYPVQGPTRLRPARAPGRIYYAVTLAPLLFHAGQLANAHRRDAPSLFWIKLATD